MKKNKLWISLSITVALAVIILSSLWMPRVEITASPSVLSLSIGRVQADIVAGTGIIYPAEIKIDKEKLNAVYSLLEQMRLEHNRVGDIARSDWKTNEGKWAEYAKIFSAKQLPLLQEQNKLRDALRKATYTDTQWKALDDDQKTIAMSTLYGDKSTEKTKTTKATADSLAQLKAIDLKTLDGKFVDPLQDFTGFTETDSGGDITITNANTITIDSMARDANSYVYKDCGAGHFGDFTHLLHIYKGTFTDPAGSLLWWAVTNATTQTQADLSTAANGMGLTAYASSSQMVTLQDYSDGTNDQYQGDANGDRYLTVSRASTTGQCLIYTDAARTTLVDTVSLTVPTTTFRYLAVACSRDAAGTGDASGVIYDLDLQEAAAGPSLTNSPASRDMGILAPSNTFWSKNGASAPSFPLTAGNCTFMVTNNGTISINISANATNPSGGSGATLIMSNPGSDQIRVSLYKAGDESADNLTLTTTQQAWLSTLAASANVSWDMKLEVGTSSESPPTEKTFHIYLVAVAS